MGRGIYCPAADPIRSDPIRSVRAVPRCSRDLLPTRFFPPQGSFVAASDIDFYLDVDPSTGAEMVIVSDTVHMRHHAEYLARHITKFEEIVRCAIE